MSEINYTDEEYSITEIKQDQFVIKRYWITKPTFFSENKHLLSILKDKVIL